MTALVTGAAGFIGARIVKALRKQDRHVIAMDRDFNAGRLDDFKDDPKVVQVVGDTRDRAGIEKAVQDHGITRILHAAALLIPTTEDDPCLGIDVNIVGTNNVFDVAAKNNVKTVVYTTSISTYGDQSEYGEEPVDEDSPQRCWSLYSVSKLTNELTAEAFRRNTGLDVRGLRIPSVFGHGRLTGRMASPCRMITNSAVGETSISDLLPSQTSAYIYVDDVAESLVHLCFAEKPERSIYCAGSHRKSLAEVEKAVKKFIPDADIRYAPDAQNIVQINNMSAARFEKDIGYIQPDFEQRVLDQINEARRERQMAPIA